MFKLKPGNVIQKINKMDRKQAYTLGAIGVVLFIALISLASFLGNADDTSFDDFSARGYDLAQMPFATDEAEQFLLSSKYSDMQNNGATTLYSAEEKEARQEEDEKKAAEEEIAEDTGYSGSTESKGYSGRGGYVGRGGGVSSPTQIGSLGSASMGHASGSGVNATWGAKGDFSPYKSQDKGSERQFNTLKTDDAKRSLFQTARSSRAAAGLKDGRGGNTKKAMMGGTIAGSDAFTDNGIDLSKAGGLELDTNAPITSADLGNLEDKVNDANKKAEKEKEKEEQSLGDKLMEQLLSGLINMGMQGLTSLMNKGIDSIGPSSAANKASKQYGNEMINEFGKQEASTCKGQCATNVESMLCGTTRDCMAYQVWSGGGQKAIDVAQSKDFDFSNRKMRSNLKSNGDNVSVTPVRENGKVVGYADMTAEGTQSYTSSRGAKRSEAYHDNYTPSNQNYGNGGIEYNSEAAAKNGCGGSGVKKLSNNNWGCR